jgi:hypothetical protein
MTVVDEESRVPPLDDAVLERLGRALDRDGMVSAMLIQLDLITAAGGALHTDEVDIVMLNRTPPLMRHRAIRDGKRLVERDHDERVRHCC